MTDKQGEGKGFGMMPSSSLLLQCGLFLDGGGMDRDGKRVMDGKVQEKW